MHPHQHAHVTGRRLSESSSTPGFFEYDDQDAEVATDLNHTHGYALDVVAG